jgi:Ca-activated chloride channel family protein
MTAGGWILAEPAWLLLLLVLPAIAWLRARRGRSVLVIPFASRWSASHAAPRSRLPAALVLSGLVLLAVALARPQRVDERRQVRQQGYDIVLAIDLSGSMLAEDYERGGQRINRLQAIKPIIDAFIARRPSDRIGIVTFGGRAYTLAPLTADHDWLRRQVSRLKVGLIEDGTAIGDGLALALSRLGQADRFEDGRRLGGFAILLTDGASNAGEIDPLQAAQIAASKGIPVYTIAAGRDGVVPMPVFDEAGRTLGYRDMLSDVDVPTLRAIAGATGGRYFRATDASTVDDAFAAIDRERKIEFDATATLNVQELYAWFAWTGLAVLLLGYACAGGRAAGAALAGWRRAAAMFSPPAPPPGGDGAPPSSFPLPGADGAAPSRGVA